MTSSLNCYSLSLCGPLPGEGPTMRSGETLSREVSPHQVKQGKSSAGRGWIYSCLSPATLAAPGFLVSLSTSALTGLGHFTAAGRKNGMDPGTSRQAQALPAGNLGMFRQMRPQALAMLYCHLCPGCTMWHDEAAVGVFRQPGEAPMLEFYSRDDPPQCCLAAGVAEQFAASEPASVAQACETS
nr:uncharacterized protein LOC123572300 [Macaca fascicularis]